MSEWTMKRFWKAANVTELDDGASVALDDKPLRTPAKAPLILPTRAMARAVAEEWEAQDENVDPASMPMTRTANSAIDKVVPQRAEIVEMLAEYGRTDLLSYRAEAPDVLVARQDALWDPLLDWASDTYGARLVTTAGVMPVAQDPDAIARLAAPMKAMSPFELASFHDLVALTGSLVLGLAASDGAYAPDAVWALSRLDEEWQAEQWGRDEEADAVAARKHADFRDAHRFLTLSRSTG